MNDDTARQVLTDICNGMRVGYVAPMRQCRDAFTQVREISGVGTGGGYKFFRSWGNEEIRHESGGFMLFRRPGGVRGASLDRVVIDEPTWAQSSTVLCDVIPCLMTSRVADRDRTLLKAPTC